MSADAIAIVLYVLFVGSIAAIPLYILSLSARQTRGTFGRPYPRVVENLMQETARRTALLAKAAEVRDARIARLERRAESAR